MRISAEAAVFKLVLSAAFTTSSLVACNLTGSSSPAPAPASAAIDTGDDSGATGQDSGTSGDDSGDVAAATATGAAGGTGGLYVSGDPSCQSPSACTPANPGLLVTLQNGALTGTTNETVNWQFVGYDKNSSTREIAVILGGLPPDAYSDPTLQLGTVTSNVVVNWTPTIPTSGSFTVILRDWDRCLVTEVDNTVCIANEYNSKYDTQQPAQPYIISMQPGTGVTCPSQNLFSGLIGQNAPPGCPTSN